MDVLRKALFLLLALHNAEYVHSQTDVQTFFNAFCNANADNMVCHSKPLVTEGGAGGSIPGLDQGSSVACLPGTKRCTQMPNLCVPSDIPCSVIDAANVHNQTDVQTFLNAFCKANAYIKGCHSKPLVTEGGAGGSIPGLDQSSNVACLPGTKRCTQMPNLCVPSDIPCSVIDAAYVHSQTDVQTFLNAFCRANADNKGCHSKPLVTEGGAGGSIPGLDQGSNVACLPGTKRCTQMPKLCVPSDIPCSVIGEPDSLRYGFDAANVHNQTDVQTFLNAFCKANAYIKGCHSKPLVTEGGAGGSISGLDQGSNVACLPATKRCTQMPNLCVPSDIPCSVIDAAYVHSQTDVQTFLNAFCRANADNKGCHSKPLVTEGGAGGSIPGLDQGSNVACLPGTKRCTQMPNLCVPSDIPCSVIDAVNVHNQTDVQTFLNAFCKANAYIKGCHSKPLVTEGGAGGSIPGLDQGSNVACLPGTKRCTQMPNLCVPSDIPCSVIDAAYVHSQTDVQTFLNAFCKANADNKGCHSKPLVTEGGAGGSIPGLDQGSNVACLPGTKRCTQMPNVCVPSDIPCSAIGEARKRSLGISSIGSDRFCEQPKAINTKQRVLVCGDGSTVYVMLGLALSLANYVTPWPIPLEQVVTLEPFQLPKDKNGNRSASWAPRPGEEKSPPQSVKEILPGKYESISYKKYLVVKTIGGVSIVDLDIFEVHRKIVEVVNGIHGSPLSEMAA
ncbi:uncharacterized protein LOC134764295 [Penaeus indicus]|uniref:uncharacterized protein LOC134764295 n=1 Tax=Penaeus indicus TaxID=29960 RepID=UPI00300C0637